MKSKKHPAWLVLEPAIGIGVGVFIAYLAAKQAVAAAWEKL